MGCSLLYRKCNFLVASFLVICPGLLLVLFWRGIFTAIMNSELSLKEGTMQYKNWIKTPIDINFEAYLYNWTNSQEFKNGKIWLKPKFSQLGPYVYTERHTRDNVIFNENHTLSFNTIRRWNFLLEKTNGSLEDKVTIINPIALAVGKIAKDKHYLIRRGIHYFFEENNVTLATTKTVSEFMFDGYNDILLDIARKLNIKGFEIPWDKFGWFYSRNGSAPYDGNYTIWTGDDDAEKRGVVDRWNQSPISSFYDGECGFVNASTGEVWAPIQNIDFVQMFLSDTCSKVTLDRNGFFTQNGIEGYLYESTNKMFDNGTLFKEMSCFSPGEKLPSGVRNISDCKFKAPAFISLPHFFLADDSYLDAVEGLEPNQDEHKMLVVLQPDLGLPLKVQATFQSNLRMINVEGIDLFEKVNDVMVPMMWCRVTAEIPEDQVFLIKLALATPLIGICFGYFFILLGVIFFSIHLKKMFRNKPMIS